VANITVPSAQEYEGVLDTVRQWPASQRLNLAMVILKTLAPDVQGSHRHKVSGAEAAGILSGPWPVPTDVDVERLVSDYLTEKYG
jgi:hypothetical protein